MQTGELLYLRAVRMLADGRDHEQQAREWAEQVVLSARDPIGVELHSSGDLKPFSARELSLGAHGD